MLDLGGASTQIVFEPTFALLSAVLSPGEHVYDLTFAGKDYVLYQHSHLGFGLMQGRRAVHNLIAFNYLWAHSTSSSTPLHWDSLSPATRIPNPCLYLNTTKLVTLDPPSREKVQVTMVGTGRGFDACRRVVETVLRKDEQCLVEPCAFGGVYQPSLREVFGGDVYAYVPPLPSFGD